MGSIMKAIEKLRKEGRARGRARDRGEKGKFAPWNKLDVKLFECKRCEN